MRRSLLTYLEDINLAIFDIESFTANKSFAEYKLDKMIQAAVEHKFMIIGEVFARMQKHFQKIGIGLPMPRSWLPFAIF